MHYVDDSVPFEETLGALDAAVAAGKVRYAGRVELLRLAHRPRRDLAAAVRAGRAPIVANQMRYSLVDRGIEREVVAACAGARRRHLPVVAAGRRRADRQVPRPGCRRTPAPRSDIDPDLVSLDQPGAAGIVEAVATAAEGLATSPVAVALAWVRDRPGVVAPILGARTLGQLTGALACESLELPREIRAALDDVSAPSIDYPEDVH